MILVDFSSIVHRMMFVAAREANPREIDGKFITQDFVGVGQKMILESLFALHQEHKGVFGDIVICLDNKSSDGYWRKDVYPQYKENRINQKAKSKINFTEVHAEVDAMVEQIEHHLPWKVVSVPRAEADDVILVLSRVYGEREKILIYSPDKDLMQAQINNKNVKQYSPLTRKFMVPETKGLDMETWIRTHVCIGDDSDNIPKITLRSEFSDAFLEYLEECSLDLGNPHKFVKSGLSADERKEILGNFKGTRFSKVANAEIPDIFRPDRFGPAALEKRIAEYGSLDEWLDSNPVLRHNYERNATLILESGIPEYIRDASIQAYQGASTEYNSGDFVEYLRRSGIRGIELMLPSVFPQAANLEDFGW